MNSGIEGWMGGYVPVSHACIKRVSLWGIVFWTKMCSGDKDILSVSPFFTFTHCNLLIDSRGKKMIWLNFKLSRRAPAPLMMGNTITHTHMYPQAHSALISLVSFSLHGDVSVWALWGLIRARSSDHWGWDCGGKLGTGPWQHATVCVCMLVCVHTCICPRLPAWPFAFSWS